KPIWAAYNSWHGAYGSVDDRLDGQEIQHYSRFLTHAQTHPRYRWLIRDEKVQEEAPYHGYSSKADGKHYEENGSRFAKRNLRFMPNLRLSKILDLRNGLRVSKKLTEHPKFSSTKYSVFFSLVCQSYKSAEADEVL